MKKRTWAFLIIYLLAIFWPSVTFAQSVSNTPANQQTPNALSLTPPATDLSVGYLSNIFGVVDGVLSGTGSQLLGAMFSIFNGAVLVLGGIVILYTLLVSTISTAHEGEVLGKRWSSVWIPVRSVMGIALLIPKATGYSFIQIFMVWVAVMGVGAADSVWNAALNYFLSGGVLMQQNTSVSKIADEGGATLLSNSSGLLRSLTCTYMLQRQLENYRNYQIDTQNPNPIDPVPNFFSGIMNQINNNLGNSVVYAPGTTITINFPASGYHNTDNACGSVSWIVPNLGNNTSSLAPQSVQTLAQSRTAAVQVMVTKLYGAAQAIVNNALVDDPANNRLELGHILSSASPMVWGGGTLSKPTPYLLSGSTLSDATTAYFGIMGPTLNYIKNAQQLQNLASQWINNAKSDGWILAGRYYYDVITLNKGMTFSKDNPPTFNTSALATLTTNTNVTDLFSDQTYVADLDALVNGSSNYQVGSKAPFINDAVTYGKSLTYGQITTNVPQNGAITGNVVANQLLGAFTLGFGSVIAGFADLGNAQGLTANPILAMATLGSGLVSATIAVFVLLAVIALGVTSALGAAWGFTFSVSMVTFMITIMGLLTPILLALLVTGLTMAFYIPIIPFIIFTFGAIGWFISVIEAVIAAPLVALGIAHPEGQEVLGKAEPAVILLVNVFLRPTFMIFGLLIGMMLSYVGIWLLNRGFNVAYASAVTPNVTAFAWIFYPLAMLCIYTLLALQVVQKSFTLIHVIPDEVLKWIGGNIRGMGGEGEAERAVSSGFGTAAQKQGEAVSGSTKAAHKLAGQMYAENKKNEEENTPSISSNTSPNGGGGNVKQENSGSGNSNPNNTGGGQSKESSTGTVQGLGTDSSNSGSNTNSSSSTSGGGANTGGGNQSGTSNQNLGTDNSGKTSGDNK